MLWLPVVGVKTRPDGHCKASAGALEDLVLRPLDTGSHLGHMTDPDGALRVGASASGGPSAFLFGRAHLVMHGNLEYKAVYGAACLGQPAREVMVDLPRPGFELMDRVLTEGRALAMRVRMPGGDRRLVVAPRKDPETGETYGVIVHLRLAPIPVPPEA
jgi:hypothetical protein